MPGSVLAKHFIERTEASDMECGRGVRHERSYRFRRPDDGLWTENVLHPAKAVAPMQACAVHLRDRTPKARLAKVANPPQLTMQALNRVPFMRGMNSSRLRPLIVSVAWYGSDVWSRREGPAVIARQRCHCRFVTPLRGSTK